MKRNRGNAQEASVFARVAVGMLVIGLGAVLLRAIRAFPPESTGLSNSVQTALGDSGVGSPVTAVLMNFRGYDTVVEVAVLLSAVLGILCVGVNHPPREPSGRAFAGPVLASLVRVVVPLMIVIAGYMVWVGSSGPGGAFQAGAVLGAAWILLMLSDRSFVRNRTGWSLRLLVVSGFLTFLTVGAATLPVRGYFLGYPRVWAGALITLIETALAVSISLMLALLFAGTPSSISPDNSYSGLNGRRL